jgi:beta-lactamase regulating signal transducer with metallopeptidase domain
MNALADQLLGYGAWMALLAFKATVLLTVALVASRLLREQSARVRHSLWTITFAALATLPLLHASLPGLPVPGLGWAHHLSRAAGSDNVEISEPAAGFVFERAPEVETSSPKSRPSDRQPPALTSAAAEEPGNPRQRSEARWLESARIGRMARLIVAGLIGLWLMGTGAIAALLGLAMWKARRIAGRAPLIRHAGWLRDFEDVRSQLGIRRAIALRVSDAVDTPMAGGVLAPFVLLPREALAWPSTRRRVVLQHELAHVRGLDPLRALVARVAAALYWFHPLVWIAGRDAVLARESACDETVVELGTRPSLYATVLLELSGPTAGSPIPALVLPMIQRSLLETRLMSILKSDRPRAGRRLLLATAAVMSVAALSVAAAAPQEETSQEEGPPKVRVEKVKPEVVVAPEVRVVPKVRVETAAPEPKVRVETVLSEPKVRVETVLSEPKVRVETTVSPKVRVVAPEPAQAAEPEVAAEPALAPAVEEAAAPEAWTVLADEPAASSQPTEPTEHVDQRRGGDAGARGGRYPRRRPVHSQDR